jgi:hypothetical protein
MSGYDPLNYLASLREYGLALRPRYVLCMIYEGNDFRSSKRDEERHRPSLAERLSTYADQSPLLNAMDRLLIRMFGPINCRAAVRGAEAIDWLPLAVPHGSDAKHYAFAPKQLRDLLRSADEFEIDPRWLNTRRILSEMNELCRANDATLMILYAPNKAHVVLPLARDRVSGEKVRAFTAMSVKRELPNADEFIAMLFDRMDGVRSVLQAYAEGETIPFLDLTAPLRRAAAEGLQVYFTYDQHWTPEGHDVAARAAAATLDERIEGHQFALPVG